jgi:hypothetical protein
VTDGVEQATEVVAARARLIGFVGRCRDEQWTARPLAVADPRAVGVIVDHVADADADADAYEYLGSFVTKLARNEHVDVSPEIVDELNAHHASAMSSPSPEQVIAHLMRSGDAFVALVEPLDAHQLSKGHGDVTIARFAEIAARHADTHRTQLEVALGL